RAKMRHVFPGSMPMRRIMLCLAFMGLAATAAAGTGPAAVKAALKRMAPGATVADVAKAPLTGCYQPRVGGLMVYVCADGNWIMFCNRYDADRLVNLSESSIREVRRQALASVPACRRIIYAHNRPDYTVTVFSNLGFSYCRADP